MEAERRQDEVFGCIPHGARAWHEKDLLPWGLRKSFGPCKQYYIYSMRVKQLLLFEEESDLLESQDKNEDSKNASCGLASSSVKESFSICDIPFLGCDFAVVYPAVAFLVPEERVLFTDFGVNAAVMCEIICSAICHQINWIFLRESVYNYTKENPEWLQPCNLSEMGSRHLSLLLGSYHKKEKIKAEERAAILRAVGRWSKQYKEIKDVFLDGQHALRRQEEVYSSLQKCVAFASDPEGKKANLLLQKLSSISDLCGIDRYAKPAIDYHLLRLYLRRGLLLARTKYANMYVRNPEIERKENTVAALRELCSKILRQISLCTDQSISTINQIEWQVARSVCQRECPDCELKGEGARWLKPEFSKCPFHHTCIAYNYPSEKLMFVREPAYKGTSY